MKRLVLPTNALADLGMADLGMAGLGMADLGMADLVLRYLVLGYLVLGYLGLAASPASAEGTGPFAVDGQKMVAEFHAEGAQIYECKIDSAGASSWVFREPIATLLLDDRTAGQHYAGPSWQLPDGSLVKGKLADKRPGASTGDIPLLQLEAIGNSGKGQLAPVSTILRLDTVGGVLEGPCEKPGGFRSVPYNARYVFLAKP